MQNACYSWYLDVQPETWGGRQIRSIDFRGTSCRLYMYMYMGWDDGDTVSPRIHESMNP
jgi:hypothetical protein